MGADNHQLFFFYLLLQALHLSVALLVLLAICLPSGTQSRPHCPAHIPESNSVPHLFPSVPLSLLLPGPPALSYLNFRRGFLVVLGGLSFNLVLALPDALCRQPLQSLLLVVAGGFWVLVTGVLLGQVRECW